MLFRDTLDSVIWCQPQLFALLPSLLSAAVYNFLLVQPLSTIVRDATESVLYTMPRFIILHRTYADMSRSQLYCGLYCFHFSDWGSADQFPLSAQSYIEHCRMGCWLLLYHWFMEEICVDLKLFWTPTSAKINFRSPTVHSEFKWE